MEPHNFYYRFKAMAIDFSDEKDVKKYSQELTSFSCLNDQLNKLKSAYDNATKERADIIINVLPCVAGVTELQVFHNIRFKLFSHTVKVNCFSFCATKFDDDKLYLHFYDTNDFNEVKRIFEGFIEKKSIPDLNNWDSTVIG